MAVRTQNRSVDGICHQTDSMNRFYLDVKAAVNTVLILSKSCMFFWVFRFAKNTNFLLKGGIRFFL